MRTLRFEIVEVHQVRNQRDRQRPTSGHPVDRTYPRGDK
jgi:hypothetical protein